MSGLEFLKGDALGRAKLLLKTAEQNVDASLDYEARQGAIIDQIKVLIKKEKYFSSIDLLQNYPVAKQAIWDWEPDLPEVNDQIAAAYFQNAILDELNENTVELLLQQEQAILERFDRYEPVLNNDLQAFKQQIELLRKAKSQGDNVAAVGGVVKLLGIMDNKIEAEAVVKDLLKMTQEYQKKLEAYSSEIYNEFNALNNKAEVGNRWTDLGTQKLKCKSAQNIVSGLITTLTEPKVSAVEKIENFQKVLKPNTMHLESAFKDQEKTSHNFIQKIMEKIMEFFQGKKVSPSQKLVEGYKEKLSKMKTDESECNEDKPQLPDQRR